MKIRKLISLYYDKNMIKYYIDYAYYENDKWIGESESCYLTKEELYNLIKPKLKKERNINVLQRSQN